MSEIKCLVCDSNVVAHKFDGLLVCEKCKFITANANLSDAELSSLYSGDYFHGQEYGNYIRDKKTIQINFAGRLKKILKYISEPRTKKLFEIGCAYGFFLEIAQAVFERTSGIDISDDAVGYAKNTLNMDAHSGDFLKHELDTKYDVFCMWDTIEHLKSPHLFIEKVSGAINKDGLLAITTGDIESLNARLRGEKWRHIHPPTHLHYFSKKTLSLLLERYGFDVVHTSYPSAYMSFDHIFYILFVLKSKNEKIYNFIEKLGLLNLKIKVNMMDFLFIVGKKK
jgi:SAM-dependent methyltransferase